MRLEIGAGAYRSLVLEDTVATHIEDKLLRAVERVQAMTDNVLAQQEAQRQREIEEAKERERAAALAQRGRAYGKWLKALEVLRYDFVRHRDMSEVATGLGEAVSKRDASTTHFELLQEYLSWAEGHVAETDPFKAIWLPEGERPDLTYPEWQKWQAGTPQWMR